MRTTLVALAATAVGVVVCFLLVDEPVANFVARHPIDRHGVLKAITTTPPILRAWTPAILAAVLVWHVAARRARPPARWERTIAGACLSLLVADQCAESLKFVFGRAWPKTWIDDNPSLVANGVYGFNWFHGGEEFGCFPSGHMAITVGFFSVLWIASPRLRPLCALACATIAVALVGKDYHFVGDILGGSSVGFCSGLWIAGACGLTRSPVDLHAFDPSPTAASHGEVGLGGARESTGTRMTPATRGRDQT
ncbi:MAG: phosphatase PAP2 family protein [Phycisphaerales bacterium]